VSHVKNDRKKLKNKETIKMFSKDLIKGRFCTRTKHTLFERARENLHFSGGTIILSYKVVSGI
jgi:hypothetical protein